MKTQRTAASMLQDTQQPPALLLLLSLPATSCSAELPHDGSTQQVQQHSTLHCLAMVMLIQPWPAHVMVEHQNT
jgi:hypothetical protein